MTKFWRGLILACRQLPSHYVLMRERERGKEGRKQREGERDLLFCE